MLKTDTKTTYQPLPIPTYHNKVKGDTVALTEFLEKKKLNRVSKSCRGRHEIIPVDDLTPIDSQRNTNTSWIKKVLTLSVGFDEIAAGIIQVCRDPETGKNYVWDGAGRLALASATGVTSLDCWVVDMTQAQQNAAHYFVYTQKTSSRNFKPGEIFINAYEHGDREAIAFADTLKSLGMRIQGAHDYWVPRVSSSEKMKYPTCAERSVRLALRIASNDISVVRHARDTIVEAGWNDDQIRSDLLPGLALVYTCYPELMRNGLNKCFRSYFQSLAGTVVQSKLRFKEAGGNMHNREAESVAIGIIKHFHASPSMTSSQKNVIRLVRIKAYVAERMNTSDSSDNDDIDD